MCKICVLFFKNFFKFQVKNNLTHIQRPKSQKVWFNFPKIQTLFDFHYRCFKLILTIKPKYDKYFWQTICGCKTLIWSGTCCVLNFPTIWVLKTTCCQYILIKPPVINNAMVSHYFTCLISRTQNMWFLMYTRGL